MGKEKTPHMKAVLRFSSRMCAIYTLCRWIKRIAQQVDPDTQFLVCLDLDDTVLRGNRLLKSGHALYSTLQQCPNIHLIFVTARLESLRDVTKTALERTNMTNYEYLFMFPDKTPRNSHTVSSFKMHSVEFAAMTHSYKVLALIGDSWSDLVQFPMHGNTFDFAELDIGSSFIVQQSSVVTTLLKLGKNP